MWQEWTSLSCPYDFTRFARPSAKWKCWDYKCTLFYLKIVYLEFVHFNNLCEFISQTSSILWGQMLWPLSPKINVLFISGVFLSAGYFSQHFHICLTPWPSPQSWSIDLTFVITGGKLIPNKSNLKHQWAGIQTQIQFQNPCPSHSSTLLFKFMAKPSPFKKLCNNKHCVGLSLAHENTFRGPKNCMSYFLVF